MLRGLFVRCLWLGIVCAAASLVQAQDFSADLMDLSGPQPTAVGKIYAKGDKLRVEHGGAREEPASMWPKAPSRAGLPEDCVESPPGERGVARRPNGAGVGIAPSGAG